MYRITNILIIALLAVAVSGCSTVRELQIFEQEVPREKLNLSHPEAAKMEPLQWVIITSENAEEVFAKHLGKALNRKDWQNRTIGELFSELESVSVDMADKYHDAYDIAMKKAGKEPMNFKESRDEFDSFLDDVVDGMVTEEIAGTSVEEAEVVMAARALSNDIQDHIERLGRMVNEDIPAIADSMSHEFGLEKAQSFKTGMEELLASTLDANKACKDGIDNILGGITGEGSVADDPMAGGDDMGAMDEPALDDVPMDNFDGADAEAGPLEEPLGRLEKE